MTHYHLMGCICAKYEAKWSNSHETDTEAVTDGLTDGQTKPFSELLATADSVLAYDVLTHLVLKPEYSVQTKSIQCLQMAFCVAWLSATTLDCAG